ncbi:Alpha-ketoglutarate-dependent taurine dioxygenase [Penicillium subrubescens]|uniref:Alpha-ketoglutarate-dependent taurine dioxygenase n=1 Tax=Penicillium subrubescens TaxID=1316194 RepID=A0A1Q5U3C1_9EURO|nr:Alpha-ketoglutarate-dependent taurine dioxygenase [Penicillium subrubescens]
MVAPILQTTSSSTIKGGNPAAQSRLSSPLQYSGSLNSFSHSDLTPVIGREYTGIQITDILKSENSDQIIQDFAVTVSQRGVVFLRNQDVTPQQMRDFGERLSHLSGCMQPSSSTLHIHPLTEESSELGDQISVISSTKQKKGGGLTHQLSDTSRFASVGWHSDISFEPVPSDYAMLKIHELPSTGGDTLWASGYEVYDRLSPAFAIFLEAVTGWKSVYVNRGFTRRINGVTKDESDVILQYLFNLVTQNHDAQVRFKWNKNDIAIWDNRSTWHTATYDYTETRTGDRVCSLGEAPYFDSLSKSRRQALGEGA